MQIRELWVQFYKSFNFDYELKAVPTAQGRSWQVTRDGWMPHVRIPLESDITAVVGANESGKTHLLDAIKIALTGQGQRERDFCRSSSLFSVEQDSRLYPEIGLSLVPTTSESTHLTDAAIPLRENGDLLMLRPKPERIDAISADDERVELSAEQVEALQQILPRAHELKTDIALPDSVSISALARSEILISSRKRRYELFTLLGAIETEDDATRQGPSIYSLIGPEEQRATSAEQLGTDLLVKVARIDRSSFAELQTAIREEREGLVNGLIQEMNNSIERHLNVSRWWSQDPEFQLRVSPREHELVFTIRDRTGTDYSFTERSKGLRYFLSYYTQLLAHDRPDGQREVLLMDEPDAYLSASGQQDLLRVLEHYARPDDSSREDQVVYVTHSPFLINKNAGHRVRVVDKGVRDEGTRLVKDATQNHYEPLRTSLGATVAETAFIGGDNLFVEGIADQVLLAGMNARLLRAGRAPSHCLDLNQVTIVPGGSNIPYMLYLARGRDQVKPACAVLLDGDDAGVEARRQIKRGGARGKPTVAPDLVVLVSEWASSAGLEVTAGVVVEEPEDLVPLSVAAIVGRRYAQTFLGVTEEAAAVLTKDSIQGRLESHKGSLWDSLHEAFRSAFATSINKAGFAKELLAHVNSPREGARPQGVPALDDNFAKLLHHLADTLRLARERETDDRRDERVNRIIETFISDYPSGCIRDRASVLLRQIDSAVDDTLFGDAVQAGTGRIRRQYKLASDPLKSVNDYPQFLDSLRNLRLQPRLKNQGLLG